MVRTAGIAGKLFCAMGETKYNTRVINQVASRDNITFWFPTDKYEQIFSS